MRSLPPFQWSKNSDNFYLFIYLFIYFYFFIFLFFVNTPHVRGATLVKLEGRLAPVKRDMLETWKCAPKVLIWLIMLGPKTTRLTLRMPQSLTSPIIATFRPLSPGIKRKLLTLTITHAHSLINTFFFLTNNVLHTYHLYCKSLYFILVLISYSLVMKLTFDWYTVEYPTSDLVLLSTHMSLKASVYTEKNQVTSGIFTVYHEKALHN